MKESEDELELLLVPDRKGGGEHGDPQTYEIFQRGITAVLFQEEGLLCLHTHTLNTEHRSHNFQRSN